MKAIDERYFDKNDKIKNKTIEDYLEKGEKILWRGKPKKISNGLSKGLGFFPVALLWGIIDVGAIIMISSSGINEMLFFIIPFFALHMMPVWIYIGMVVKGAKEFANTTYAITNKRVLSKKGVLSEQFYGVKFEEILSIDIKRDIVDKMLKCGDIYITAENTSFVLSDISNSTFIYEKLYKIVNENGEKREFYKNNVICDHCTSYYDKNAKRCPNCGAKNQEYKL